MVEVENDEMIHDNIFLKERRRRTLSSLIAGAARKGKK
jgi:hypothetical protein